MTPYRKTELALSFFVLFLGVATVWLARYTIEELSVLQDRIGARGFAYVIGSLVALGGLVLVVSQIRALRRGLILPDGDATELGGDDPRFPASAGRSLAVFLALIAYAALLRPAGYIAATALFIGGGTLVMGGRGLARLVIYPLMFAVGSYLLFDTVLGVRIPDGILAPVVRAIGLA